jgi:hypothetical protein
MPETINIDGRGITVRDAIREMRDRMRPLEQRGFHPISEVEIVDTAKNAVIQTFTLTDPEFLAHVKSDQEKRDAKASNRLAVHPHAPERKEAYAYIARIQLEA